jgi:hypothetical protein
VSDEALVVGTPVNYWPGWRDGEPKQGVVDSDRTLLGGHTWGYYVRKGNGAGSDFIAETHIEVDERWGVCAGCGSWQPDPHRCGGGGWE